MHEWVGKGKLINCELCKRLKFDHKIKYAHKAEPVPKNKTPKILLYFELQTDYLISARRFNLELINKKKELVI